MAIWDWENPGKARWAFVVDTTDYAGNFERELAAYVVGRCDLDDPPSRVQTLKDLYHVECPKDPFEDLVTYRVDDHGDDHISRSPMALAPTPGKKKTYNSVAIFLDRKPKEGELRLLIERSQKFKDVIGDRGPKKVLSCRLVQERTVVESEEVWRA